MSPGASFASTRRGSDPGTGGSPIAPSGSLTSLDQVMILPNFHTRYDVLEQVGNALIGNIP